jgi:2-desacetyl-2-hydroxyethyl bacteriochlorophyllide A dehydrogenase
MSATGTAPIRVVAPPAERVGRAAIVVAPGRVELHEQRVPAPGPGQVRIRVDGCGVCGSDLPVWEGRPWFRYPLPAGAPGHEIWGVVDAVGADVIGWQPGERVAALASQGYADHVLAAASSVVALDGIHGGAAFPCEPVACAVNAFQRSDVRPGDTVAVVGIGFLGALLAQLASRAGARVIAISRRPFALGLARAHGAGTVLPLDDPRAVLAAVGGLTDGAGCARVLEATGQQAGLDLAGELVAVGGRLVIAGYHQDGPRQVNMQLWNWRGIDVINAHERDPRVYTDGMERAVREVREGRLDLDALLTHHHPLEGLADAFEQLKCRPDGFLKAVVHCR